MNSRQCKELIKQEIEWCQKNPMGAEVPLRYRDGFIAGLWQALYLIRQGEQKRFIDTSIRKSAKRKKIT